MRKYVISIGPDTFTLPQEYISLAGCQEHDDGTSIRTDPRLIEIVESPSYHGNLKVVSVPDCATDIYLVKSCGGGTTLLYVEDGFIFVAD